MKPVPQGVLLTFILTLCGLCAWQWRREAALRGIAGRQFIEINNLQFAAHENDERINAADAGILRLTSTLTELRANSIPATEQEELQQTSVRLREGFDKQTAVLNTQNEALTKANTAIQQANATIQKLTGERDALTKRLNETTAKYNKLAKQ